MLHLMLRRAPVAILPGPALAVAAAPSLEAAVHASIRDAFCPKPRQPARPLPLPLRLRLNRRACSTIAIS